MTPEPVLAAALVVLAALRSAAGHAVARSRLIAAEPVQPAPLPARQAQAVDPVTTLPDVVDLLRVASDAGHPAPAAAAAVASRAPPPWDVALAAVDEACRRGRLFADAVDDLARLGGGPGRRLAAVLRTASAGADLSAGLDRLAADARDVRRRRTEAAARRVPVRLLAPLVLCVLPAFVLLALAPLVAGALTALDP